ncbi:DNA-directed DNA polymerase [Tanacetum coccineum]
MAAYSQKWHNETSRTRSTETSDGLAAIQAQLNNLGREIKKVNEKVYAAQVGCEQCKGPHYTKDCPLKEEGKTLEEAYYTQFGGPFQGGGYKAATPGFYQRNNANPSYQEKMQSMEDTLSKFMSESTRRHKENSNLIKEIRASTDAAIRNQGASIKTLEIQIGQMSKEKDPGSFTLPCFINNVFFDNALVDLRASISVMPLSTYLNLRLSELAHTKLTVELRDRTMKYPKGIAENVLVEIGKFVFLVDFIILDMPKDIKVPLILGRPFLSTARAKIDVYKRNITLRVGEERIVFTSVKPASSLIKRVYMLSLRERMELDLEARLMGETLVINISLDPFFKDYIELNDLNEPFELRRKQRDDLMPTIDEGEVIEKFRTRNDELDAEIDDYPKVGIKIRRFKRMINNGDDEVTYKMVRSHPRFKHHTNEQCNKIPPLLKVSNEDKKNGISHPYQKIKGFYKEVLNLGPDYIRDARTVEWLTHEHISVHEME